MLATPEIAQFPLGDLAFCVKFPLDNQTNQIYNIHNRYIVNGYIQQAQEPL